MKVSVVVPAYNARACLARAVHSAMHQTLSDIEILIVDDGSSDGTRALAETLAGADARVRVLALDHNRGVSAARNIAIGQSLGDWIAPLDADDAFEPTRLERLVAVAEEQGADMVADDLALYDWTAERIVGQAIARAETDLVEPVTAELFVANCITGQSPFDYGQLKPIIRRDFVTRHALSYVEGLRHGEDFEFTFAALLGGARMLLLHSPLYVYTQRIGSVSRTPSSVARTIEDCHEMRRHTLARLGHPKVVADPSLAALLRRRARAIVWHASWESVYYAARERDLPRVIRACLKDWRVPLLLVRNTARRAAGSGFGASRRGDGPDHRTANRL